MKIYRLYEEQQLPININEAWSFFSDPKNLIKITPPDMNFEITNNPAKDIYSGMIITYKLRPIFNIPSSWVTEIVFVDEPNSFIDVQRFGPYKFWHHRHRFKAVDGGILMSDEVNYALPFGKIGDFTHSLFVKKRIKKIFDYRKAELKKIFG
jgi:ligand-binding SRPBCC domain-containing protein